MVKIKQIAVIAFMILNVGCTVLNESKEIHPMELKSLTDIRIEEVHMNNGDTIYLDQDLLLGTWLKGDSIVFYDHTGEFLNLSIDQVSGMKIRTVDPGASAKKTSGWTIFGVIGSLGLMLASIFILFGV